jgi:hypothetical protein
MFIFRKRESSSPCPQNTLIGTSDIFLRSLIMNLETDFHFLHDPPTSFLSTLLFHSISLKVQIMKLLTVYFFQVLCSIHAICPDISLITYDKTSRPNRKLSQTTILFMRNRCSQITVAKATLPNPKLRFT